MQASENWARLFAESKAHTPQSWPHIKKIKGVTSHRPHYNYGPESGLAAVVAWSEQRETAVERIRNGIQLQRRSDHLSSIFIIFIIIFNLFHLSVEILFLLASCPGARARVVVSRGHLAPHALTLTCCSMFCTYALGFGTVWPRAEKRNAASHTRCLHRSVYRGRPPTHRGYRKTKNHQKEKRTNKINK